MTRKARYPLKQNADVHFGCLSVRGVMDTFGIKQRKTVIMAIYTGKITAAKFDAVEGDRDGFWLIDAKSAYAYWDNKGLK